MLDITGNIYHHCGHSSRIKSTHPKVIGNIGVARYAGLARRRIAEFGDISSL